MMNPIFRMSTALFLTAAISSMSVATGCRSQKPNPTGSPDASQAPAPTTAPAAVQPQATPAATPPATPQMSIEDLVAPIALYPDKLLAQVLTASTNAQEVLDGGNWLLQNQNLKGDALANAAKQAGFSPSIQYLTAFPQVVDNMCQQMDWTTQLGQAFQANQKAVMDAIQQKRAQAQQVGNLKSGPQMTVDTAKADNGQTYIEIQPANPQVVYVPAYNPVTIYNTPAPPVIVQAPSTTTVVTTESNSGVSTGAAVAIGLLSFGAGMAIGSSFNNNNYYPYPSWGYGGVYYGGRPYYPPPYRPVYPGYRPAYGYHPPPNYHWNSYNNSVNHRYNNNHYGQYNNVHINNNNVNVNVNNRPGNGGGNPGLGANNNRPGLGSGNQGGKQPDWKGKSTYQGARPNGNNGKPGTSMANVNPANRPNAGNNPGLANRPNGNNNALNNRPSAGNNAAVPNRPNGGNNSALANRPNGGNAAPANRPGAGNSGSMNRPNSGNTGAMNRPATAPSNMNRGGDRGYSDASARPSGASPAARPSPPPQNRGGGNSGAFSSGGSAKSERAASNRGQASLGGNGGAKGRKR